MLIDSDDALERLEIPQRLWRFWSVSDRDWKATVDIRTARSVPAAGLETLARLGVSLEVSPRADFDLRGLKRSIEFFEQMSFSPVFGGGTYRSGELLATSNLCKYLYIGGRAEGLIDLSRLGNLRDFASPSGVGWSASSNPALESFWMLGRSSPPDLHFAGRLNQLTLGGNSRIARIGAPQFIAPL